MKRIRINENQLKILTESTEFCAGTDHPFFYDEKTDTTYEADWNTDYGYPFGFWNNGTNDEFSVGEDYCIHYTACGKVALKYFKYVMENDEALKEDASLIEEKVNEILDTIKNDGYEFNYDTQTYVNADGDEIDLHDEAQGMVNNMYVIYDEDYIYNLINSAIENGSYVSEYDICDEWAMKETNNYNFLTEDGLREALERVGTSFDDYFSNGYGEGRIWPNKEMIGFYPSEQPSPDEFRNILNLLAQNDKIPATYNEMLHYIIVFEDWRKNDGKVTACTVYDYIEGNYGEEYEEEYDEPIQYNNGKKTTFVPHLANQAQKREYYQDFRNTRDRAVYTPRERGGNGSLAQYNAMRYPYGENVKRNKKLI